ncbi:uncharacterized protein LOC117907521 [Vitis riparia]|uniref:uncharacterized protein LOC117907521 n=1 Tax=Vitis riparia TaxID=96939 RepID=UPI00155A780D|nr:uncharacterized protein LOC117907521 [Vitis riparia]
MTKFSGFWVLFLVVGTPFMFLHCSGSSIPDMVFTHHVGSVTMKATSRKLKVNGYEHNLGTDKKIIAGNVNLEDYHPIDPVPSSKASIKPGPIQHGTPLIPYIPKPSPPGHPKPGGFF